MSTRIFYTREAPAAMADMRIRGYAAVFDSPTELWSRRWEVIRRSAFDGAINTFDTRALLNHGRDNILARMGNDTLRLGTDERGLWYEADLNPDDPQHVSAYAKIQRGDVYQSSFSFSVPAGGEIKVRAPDYPDGVPSDAALYEIVTVDRLYDVSPVTYPAYDDTTVAARAGHFGEWGRREIESNPAEPVESADGEDGRAPRLLIARYNQTGARLRQGGAA
jgi:uncharacterized protein